MSLLTSRVFCFGLGAAAVYYLDPVAGKTRRRKVVDQLNGLYHSTGTELGRMTQDARHRAAGLAAEARAKLADDDAPDETVVARVRSAMGRAVMKPGDVTVSATGGTVTLTGRVPAPEVDRLLKAAYAARGVKTVINHLEVQEVPERITALFEHQDPTKLGTGGSGHGDLTGANRLLRAAGGAALALWGASRGGVLGLAGSATGLCLLSQGLTSKGPTELFGVGAGRRAVDVQKTITIDAPIDVVFGFFANYANFPRFMSNVREVTEDANGRSHWVVAGPAGIDVSWDATLLAYEPNALIAWQSVEGATVENAGVIRFDDDGGGTRVNIRLSYNPPAGAVGHLVAKLFGADPRSEMNDDLNRVKVALEQREWPDAHKRQEAERAADAGGPAGGEVAESEQGAPGGQGI
ncbi:MAG TPA: SRPBCC family protein [Humisphaera sp.]